MYLLNTLKQFAHGLRVVYSLIGKLIFFCSALLSAFLFRDSLVREKIKESWKDELKQEQPLSADQSLV